MMRYVIDVDIMLVRVDLDTSNISYPDTGDNLEYILDNVFT